VKGVTLPFATRDTIGYACFDVVAFGERSHHKAWPAGAELCAGGSTKEEDPFPAGRDRVSLPFRLIGNHIYVNVSINGKPEQPFVFYTGAVFIVDAMDISPGMRHNDDVNGAGIVGYKMSKRAIVVLDYEKDEMTLIRPAAFESPAGATVILFTLQEQIPMIAASVDGMPREFEIDTGSSLELDIMGPFVE